MSKHEGQLKQRHDIGHDGTDAFHNRVMKKRRAAKKARKARRKQR